MEERRWFCSFNLGILLDLAIYINKFFNCNIVIENNGGFECFSPIYYKGDYDTYNKGGGNPQKNKESIYCLMMLLFPDVSIGIANSCGQIQDQII